MFVKFLKTVLIIFKKSRKKLHLISKNVFFIVSKNFRKNLRHIPKLCVFCVSEKSRKKLSNISINTFFLCVHKNSVKFLKTVFVSLKKLRQISIIFLTALQPKIKKAFIHANQTLVTPIYEEYSFCFIVSFDAALAHHQADHN